MRRVDSLEKTLMLGGIGGRRRRGRQRMRWLNGILTRWMWVWVNSRSWWWTGRPGVLRFMGSHRVGHDWETELNWRIIKETFPWKLTVIDWDWIKSLITDKLAVSPFSITNISWGPIDTPSCFSHSEYWDWLYFSQCDKCRLEISNKLIKKSEFWWDQMLEWPFLSFLKLDPTSQEFHFLLLHHLFSS